VTVGCRREVRGADSGCRRGEEANEVVDGGGIGRVLPLKFGSLRFHMPEWGLREKRSHNCFSN